jgi:hypothetical protein
VADPEHLAGEAGAVLAEQVRDDVCDLAGLAWPAGGVAVKDPGRRFNCGTRALAICRPGTLRRVSSVTVLNGRAPRFQPAGEAKLS